MQTNDLPPEKKKTDAPRRNPIDQAAPGVYQKKHPTNVTRKPKWIVVPEEDGFVRKLRSHSRFTIGQLGSTPAELTATANMGMLTTAIAGDRNLPDREAVELANVLAMTQSELDHAHDIFMLTIAKTDRLAGNQGAEEWTAVLAMTQHELDQAHDTFMLTVAKKDMLMEVQEPLPDPSNMSFHASIKTEVLAPAAAGKIAVQETSLSKSTMMVDRQEMNPMQPPRKKTPAQRKLDKQMRKKAAADKAETPVCEYPKNAMGDRTLELVERVVSTVVAVMPGETLGDRKNTLDSVTTPSSGENPRTIRVKETKR
jgi:hypothetical protein